MLVVIFIAGVIALLMIALLAAYLDLRGHTNCITLLNTLYRLWTKLILMNLNY